MLQPQSDTPADAATQPPVGGKDQKDGAVKNALRLRHNAYRPSHKATFVGLLAVIVVLGVNIGVVGFIIKKQQTQQKSQLSSDQVTVDQSALDKLGVNRNSVGGSGVELTINPNTKFNGTVQVGGDVSVGGQLKLNGDFSAPKASFAELQAGKTSLQQLDVNGDGTFSSLALRKDLAVTGQTRLQGAVTVSQLMTVNNNLNVSGSVSIGGTLAVNSFHASSLTVDTDLVYGGHVISRGAAPGVGPGSALGTSGTVSISGSDAAGTVAANIGVNASPGIIANVAFRRAYSSTPHVVVTMVGAGGTSVYVNRTASGFSIGVNGAMPPGGYAFDYIVQQ